MSTMRIVMLSFLLAAALAACGDAQSPDDPKPNADPAAPPDPAQEGAQATVETLIQDPQKFTTHLRSSFQKQLELIQAGDAEALRPYFTTRHRERITPEMLEKAKSDVGGVDVTELVHSVDIDGEGAGISAKVMMENGRSLTTLLFDKAANRWLADTIWFR